ncbi:arsenite efflux transporter metallochaperone ArsD [Bacillus sp. MRMR6]|uniref:arsenite efflux transporter metallochaperone ArsD n=1 Tax=Bacillus sp. MRMR6 TaxID=1928617 RepID=UPI00095253F2|nr:arsenite efflux transporter metallochaperone ArsD [Bacillus sp. MRMR6]OLS34834.1 arsenical resistance operon transcriptional repressor ArsD [Bacillus sp. MRMR6]
MKLEIYDPAMCCPTGVCGPTIDPELARVASALFLLNSKGLSVTRYNLGTEPQAFIENVKVNQLLNERGTEVLPLVLIDGNVVKEGSYPSNPELASWFEIETKELEAKKPSNQLL